MARRPTTARPSGDGPTQDSKDITRWHKATALVPLALLVGAWSVSLGAPNTATADAPIKEAGVPAVPATSFDQPASYTVPPFPNRTTSTFGNPIRSGNPQPSSLAVNGIPTAALTAYHSAEQVLAEADPSCHVSWALIAAIGRVESDHGRSDGSVLNSDGKATPGIYGPPLDGNHNTALIADTDGAKYDGDATYDRAVGPMQFIPGAWDIVGVDGDSDGTRDPQDIDDAALATAIYLCAGELDLSTLAGQRTAVFNYNHSDVYVDLVLSIMASYLDGDYTAVADGLPTTAYIAVADEPTTGPHKLRHHQQQPRATTRSHHQQPRATTRSHHQQPVPKTRHHLSAGPSDPLQQPTQPTQPQPQPQPPDNPVTHNPTPAPRPQPAPAATQPPDNPVTHNPTPAPRPQPAPAATPTPSSNAPRTTRTRPPGPNQPQHRRRRPAATPPEQPEPDPPAPTSPSTDAQHPPEHPGPASPVATTQYSQPHAHRPARRAATRDGGGGDAVLRRASTGKSYAADDHRLRSEACREDQRRRSSAAYRHAA
ncbi:MAG: lytic transglycosylase domain-containing protein [Nocardioidaceae bacterium]